MYKTQLLCQIYTCKPARLQNEKTVVQRYVEDKGHIFVKSPRYHCRLQFIEQYWGAVKLYLRSNCDYSLSGLRILIPIALTIPTLESTRRYYTRSMRMMDAYRLGSSAQLALYITKKYKSHRRLNNQQIDLIAEQAAMTNLGV